jgi:hypothetical protein
MPPTSRPSDQVVEQFQAAIIAHDGKALGALFLQDHDSWLSVFDEKTWAEVKARNPDARKVIKSTWREFADFVQNSKKPSRSASTTCASTPTARSPRCTSISTSSTTAR